MFDFLHILRMGDRMKQWKKRWFWISVPELVGVIAGFLIRDGVMVYQAVAPKPPLSPPGAVFPVVWIVLYALMGYGAYRVANAGIYWQKKQALRLFWIQLGMNFLWPVFFFVASWYGVALAWIVALWFMIFAMFRAFRRIDRLAARLQIPYLFWTAFAVYLNLGAWVYQY